MQSLMAISAALERLNHLGTAIQRSSVTSQTTKAREFAETFDLTSFERVAYMSLKTLYPDTSDGLIEQLTRSMMETYSLFLHRRSRKERLKATRSRPRPRPPLRFILEELIGDCDGPNMTDIDLNTSRESESLTDPIPHVALTQPVYAIPQSEPTSLDSQEVKARLKRSLPPSTRSKPISILVNQVGYPRPVKDSLICDWCFGPLMPDSLRGLSWQQHINEDFRPYVCVSEECSQSLPRFASSTEWFQHMISAHGENWHREVHAPSSWVCPLCTDEDAAFLSPESLSEHLKSCHDGIFKEQQIKAIVRQSRFPSPRPKSTCPLCCFPISDEQSTPANQKKDNNNDKLSTGKQYLAKPDDSGPKRVRIGTHQGETGGNSGQTRPGVIVAPDASCPISAKAIATHMTAHLQSIMLFTLRLMSIEGPMDTFPGSQGASIETDYQGSWVSSGPRDLDQAMSEDEEGGYREGVYDSLDPGYGPPSVEAVPDSEYIDWNSIPRSHEDAAEKDDPVGAVTRDTVITTLPSGENESETQGRLLARRRVIKELVDSEYSFAKDIKIVADIYQGAIGTCPDLSSEDMRIIFRNSVRLYDFSFDFQHRLREAANSVYTISGTQDPSTSPAAANELPSADHQISEGSVISELEKDCSTSIGKAFISRTADMTEVYVHYLKHQNAAGEKLQAIEKLSRAATWLKKCPNLYLLLTNPMQRILNYPPLLETLLLFTPTDHADRESLVAAFREATDLVIRVNRAMKQQDLVNRALRGIPRPEIKKQAERLRSTKQIRTPDRDEEYEALVSEFSSKILQIEIMISDVVKDTPVTQGSVNHILDVIAALDAFITLSPGEYPEQEERWTALRITARNISLKTLPEHLEMVQSGIVRPLERLLSLYNGPSLAIAHRDHRLPDYDRYISMKSRGESPGTHITNQAEEFLALDETLKYELPKLYSLTAKLGQECLSRFVQIHKTLLDILRKELEEAVGPFQGDLEKIVDWCRRRQDPQEREVLSLSICNGSLLDRMDSLPSDHLSRGPSIISNSRSEHSSNMLLTVPAQVPYRPESTASADNEPDIFRHPPPSPSATSIQGNMGDNTRTSLEHSSSNNFPFLVHSINQLSDDLGGIRVAGLRYLTYRIGETFEVMDEEGDHWIAKKTDDPTKQLGWIWKGHFELLVEMSS
ncbi:hypothetical protein BDW59DRAFT_147545 [Aspergillus cavernicola]|uniref:DH domain-containing protein n=1 Tax=Aspergillus cavernicola TaxID=176166 RepID=A0ABR4I9D7_9EURO